MRASHLCSHSIFFFLVAINNVILVNANANVNVNAADQPKADHVSMTKEAADLRSQHLLRKKPILKKSVSITSLLFPGAEPIEYSTSTSTSNNSIKNDNHSDNSNDVDININIPMFVEYVESRKTPVGVDYSELPVCPTRSSTTGTSYTAHIKRKNLGQRLMGHSTNLLSYKITPLQPTYCTIQCHLKLSSKQILLMQKLIRKQYRVHYTLDSLPIIVRSKDLNYLLRGYPLGFEMKMISDSNNHHADNENTDHTTPENARKKNDVYLNNHLKFSIYYKTIPKTQPLKIHITGFDVTPISIQHTLPSSSLSTTATTSSSCNRSIDNPPVQNKKETLLALKTDSAGNDLDVIYSYEVEWKESEIEVCAFCFFCLSIFEFIYLLYIYTHTNLLFFITLYLLQWSDRWDIYMMETPDNEIHYFAIVNSFMIGFLLCGTVAIIMIRALKKDITRYNEFDIEDYNTPVEESGWKLVHGDVFRPPKKGRTLLSVAVGTGMQIGTSVCLTLILAVLRLLNPMKKGQILSYVILCYVLSGSVAGYTSARLFKYFAGKAWKRTTLLTASAFPAVLLTLFLTLNFGLYLSLGKVSTSVSFSTVLIAFLLWICVSTPLVFVGSYFGYKREKIDVPTKTNHIARFIPDSRSWFVKLPHSALLAGILPFGSVCIELSFIMGALWLHQIYYIMGFIMIVCTILTISCSTVSMVFCYIQLCNEDHKWWWKSFYNCASIGFYLFLYSMWYLVTKLELVGLWPFMVYSLYMGIISFACALYCGGVGVISSFWFVRKIYGAVKVD